MAANWQYLSPYGVGQNGSTTYGGGAQALIFRDPLDASRAQMGNRIPSAAYPDGYLGTIQSRREDRLLDNLKSRQNQRAYQRGVHKGERVDPGDYFWPDAFQPDSGLKAIARGVRQAPLGTVQEHLATQGRMLPRGARSLVAENFSALGDKMDTRKIDQLRRQKPGWT